MAGGICNRVGCGEGLDATANSGQCMGCALVRDMDCDSSEKRLGRFSSTTGTATVMRSRAFCCTGRGHIWMIGINVKGDGSTKIESSSFKRVYSESVVYALRRSFSW